MATPVLMPRLSPTMEEGVISTWLKKEGDSIKNSELLCEIETDKASMEYESPDAGKLVKILIEAGSNVKVDTVIAIIAEEGEKVDLDALLKQNSTVLKTTEKQESNQEITSIESVTNTSANQTEISADTRIKASPLAKSIAKDKQINLQEVKGTGPNGRIVAADLDNLSRSKSSSSTVPLSSPMAKPTQATSSFHDQKNSTMRNVIAKRLLESSQGAPEFFLTMEIMMDKAMEFRKQINESQTATKITFNDMVIKATALALRQNPKCNAYWLGDAIRYVNDIHMSVAVAIEDGLITPVIRHADKCGLAEISSQMKSLAAKAKDKKLQPDEYTGGSFSVSNLGMFGIDQFTSILNPPESGIFAVGAIVEKAIIAHSEIRVGHSMKITMTCDHRVIDGATGAQLLKDVKHILENPASLAL